MKKIAVSMILLFVTGCAGARIKSPLADKGKAPTSVEDEDCGKPVYAPPVPHIDDGDCECKDGKCTWKRDALPGHDQKVPCPADVSADPLPADRDVSDAWFIVPMAVLAAFMLAILVL